MAKATGATEPKLTKSKLELKGVQVTLTARVGDWRREFSVSPLDYRVFKQWATIYAPRAVESVVKAVEHELSKEEEK